MVKRRGKNVRRSRASVGCQEPEWLKNAPHSFIFHRGSVGRYVRALIMDLRKVFSPFTAAKLKPRKTNSLKDFIAVSGTLSVSHFVIISRSETSLNLRIMHIPRGPTLSFKILEFTPTADVVSALKKSLCYEKQFLHPPLLIFSHFDARQSHIHLVRTMIQGMLPSLDVQNVKLDNIRRCVLLSYDKQDECFEFRHYGIKVIPHGVSKQAKSILKRKVPDLGVYKDISDYFMKPEYLSDSEQEEEDDNVVNLKQDVSFRGCHKSNEVAIRLIEMGPRMKLKLFKIEEGLSSGSVLYHAFRGQSDAEETQNSGNEHSPSS